jgi:hypothetical protein
MRCMYPLYRSYLPLLIALQDAAIRKAYGGRNLARVWLDPCARRCLASGYEGANANAGAFRVQSIGG